MKIITEHSFSIQIYIAGDLSIIKQECRKYCMEKLGLREVLEYIGIDYKPIYGLISQDKIQEWTKIIGD